MITPEMIPKIEKVFGFHLYDWQKDYLLGNIWFGPSGRRQGKTFAYCLKLLLTDGDQINQNDLKNYIDEIHGKSYPHWFFGFCMEINNKLIDAGFKTRIRPNNKKL